MVALFNANTTPPKSDYFFHWWNSIPSVTFCAIHEEQLVGMFVVLKRKLINGLRCGVLMGLLVNSEWRGKGLFKELGVTAMDYCKEMDLFCCLTNAIGEKALEKNFKFRTVGSIETMTLPSKGSADCLDCTRIPITPDTRFNVFGMEGRSPLMFLADEDFRRWRFSVHPRHAYDIVRMSSDEYAVVNRYQEAVSNIRYGDIVDFEIKELEEERLMNLLNCAGAGLGRDVDMITVQAIPDSLIYRACRKMGFGESSAKHYFCITVREPSNEYLYDSTRWLIKWGDYLR